MPFFGRVKREEVRYTPGREVESLTIKPSIPKPDAYGGGCSKEPGQPSKSMVPGDSENILLSLRPAFDMPRYVGGHLKN